ncbi:PDZ domain-containing protein [Crocinitomix sp.]|nr:PDZ domain-containing protein [Crocinitomix sp.]
MIKYKITYQQPTKQYLSIDAIFDCENQSEIVLQFPAWRPGRYELGNFAKNIKNFTIHDENNKKLLFEKVKKDSWLVKCEKAKQLVVTYLYYAHEINAGSSYMDDVQLYVNPVNCLVYIESEQNKPCSLELNIPDNFKIACGATHQNNIITCEDFHVLVDSPFIASASLQTRTYEILSYKFHIWFQGDVVVDWNKVISDFEKFTKIQIEKFSNRRKKKLGFPVKEYHFLYQILPYKTYHGVEHKSGTVIALGPGNELMTERYDDFLGVSSHELYHAWNIKSIRPKEMYPYDYSKENYSYLGYVAEGVTTYLGDVFLAESNVKDFEWYRSEIEKLLQKHFDNFARFNYSVAESSWDTWLDGYVKGTPERKVSIYNEGALLAFVADMKIRQGSNNKASIHDVMYTLYHEYALKNKGYTEEDYIKLCSQYSGEDFGEIFRNQIHGTLPFESILAEAFETIGFYLDMELNPSHSKRILGIKTVEVDGNYFIQDIYPGGSAEIGELMIGDQILQVNSTPISKTLDETIAPFKDLPLELKIMRMGRELNITCPNTNRSIYPIYKIKKIKIPSNVNKRTFKSWIGYNLDEIK